MISRRSILGLALAVMLAPSLAGAAEPTKSPSDVVTAFHAALLGVMKNAETLGAKGRYERLAAPIDATFYLRLMIQVATGSHWGDAGPDQKDKLVEGFRRFSISTYAHNFDGFAGESFETLGEKPGPQKTMLVNTRIVRPGKDPVDIVYVMRKTKGQWRIVDVVVDKGISELALRRSEYNAILKSAGVDGLIGTLNAKADELLAP